MEIELKNQEYTYAHIRKRKRSPFNIMLIIFIIPCFISCAILIYNVIDDSGMFGNADNDMIYYAISLDTLSSIDNARSYADDIMERAAAGYVYTADDDYMVLACIYLNYDDAYNILTSLIDEYPNALILSIICNTPDDEIHSYITECIEDSYSLMTKVDDYSDNELDTHISSIQQSLMSISTDTLVNIKKIEYDNMIDRYNDDLQYILESGLSDNRLSALVKYQLLKIVFDYQSLTSYVDTI